MPVVNNYDHTTASGWTIRTIEEPVMQPLLISVPEAARRVGLSVTTLYTLIQAGEFPHKRVRRRLLVPVRALEEWANKQ